MHFLVKPNKFRKTPLLLKRTLGLQKLVSYPGRYQPALDYTRDLFLAFPKPDRYPNPIKNVPDSYGLLSTFYGSSKATQRKLISEYGVKTPEAYASTNFIVRPLHHFGGANYRITSNPTDFNPSSEYISPAFPKWREYRVVFVKGNPLLVLRKKPGPEAGLYDAWNHTSGSYFQTVLDRPSSPLSATSFFTDAATHPVLRDSHLIAVDVLLDRQQNYAVTEFNFSPAITIPANLEVISNAFASNLHSR